MTLLMSHAIGMFQVGTGSTWPAAMTGISTLVIAILMLVVVAGLVVAGLQLRRMSARMEDTVTRLARDVTPVLQRLHSIADSADQIAASARADVHRFSDTIDAANDALRDAIALAERRMKEFDALVRVVQREAEDAVVSAAATVRGVRAVAAAIGEETAAALAFDDAVEDSEEEMDDGDDIGVREEEREPEPRVRPGLGGRGRARRV